MFYHDALATLRNHANLPSADTPGLSDEDSFIFRLWQADVARTPPTLEHVTQNLLTCLDVVNHHLNGPHPSATVDSTTLQLERTLVWAMTSILHDGWRYHARWTCQHIFDDVFLVQLAAHLHCISSAWLAVLDGDIDSLAEHLAHQAQC